MLNGTKKWANEVDENGLDGVAGMTGKKHSEETKRKMRLAQLGDKNPMKGLPGTRLGQTVSDETKSKISKSILGTKRSIESIEKHRLTLLHNKYKQDVVECPYCHKFGGCRAMKQWHFDKCKERGTQNS